MPGSGEPEREFISLSQLISVTDSRRRLTIDQKHILWGVGLALLAALLAGSAAIQAESHEATSGQTDAPEYCTEDPDREWAWDCQTASPGWMQVTFTVEQETRLSLGYAFDHDYGPGYAMTTAWYVMNMDTEEETTAQHRAFIYWRWGDSDYQRTEVNGPAGVEIHEEEDAERQDMDPRGFGGGFPRYFPPGTHTMILMYGVGPLGDETAAETNWIRFDPADVAEPKIDFEVRHETDGIWFEEDRHFDPDLHHREDPGPNVMIEGQRTIEFNNTAAGIFRLGAYGMLSIDGPRECQPLHDSLFIRGAPSGEYTFNAHALAGRQPYTASMPNLLLFVADLPIPEIDATYDPFEYPWPLSYHPRAIACDPGIWDPMPEIGLEVGAGS